jgi:endonuclease/exonuclease/phosphatase family metal-dependent hydrolase
MKIKVATFNLYQFVKPPYSWYTKKEKFNDLQWIEKTTWIKNQILKMDCDIIGFQEVFSAGILEKLVKELGFEYFETVDVAKLSDKTYISTTVAIASKYPISKMHNFTSSFTFARIPIKASIILPNNEELLVYVAHLKSNRENEFEYIFNKEHTLEYKKEVVAKALSTTTATSLQQRLSEASALFFDMKKNTDKPIVLLCDLNDKEFSLCIDALSNYKYHYKNSVEDLLLYDTCYYYKDVVYNPHPKAKKQKRKATIYFLGKGSVFDYIFMSKHFNVSNYTVLDDHLHKCRNDLLLKSDHAQVVCELNLHTKG